MKSETPQAVDSVTGTAALSVRPADVSRLIEAARELLRLKKIKQKIEAGTAFDFDKRDYEENKERAWGELDQAVMLADAGHHTVASPVAWIWHYTDGHRSLRWRPDHDPTSSDVPHRVTPLYTGAIRGSAGGAK